MLLLLLLLQDNKSTYQEVVPIVRLAVFGFLWSRAKERQHEDVLVVANCFQQTV